MSEVSEMVEIKVNSKAIGKLKKLEKEDNDRNKTGISLMIATLSLLNNTKGDLKKYKDYSIYKTNESYTLIIAKQDSSTTLTIAVGSETFSHIEKTNSKVETRIRNSKALSAFANHSIALNNPIYDFIDGFFNATASRNFVVVNIEQNIVYDHFGTSDNVNLTRVYLLDTDNRLIQVDLSV